MIRFAKYIAAAALSASMIAALTPTASANDTGAFLGGLAAGAIVGAVMRADTRGE
jgi:predicted lipid-binding transport protein (Tim44 family)